MPGEKIQIRPRPTKGRSANNNNNNTNNNNNNNNNNYYYYYYIGKIYYIYGAPNVMKKRKTSCPYRELDSGSSAVLPVT
jgi:hypothetical protein